MHSKLIRVVALPAVIAGLAFVPAVAEASNASVKQRIIKANEALERPLDHYKSALATLSAEPTRAHAKKVGTTAKAVEKSLDHSASAVSKLSASSKRGKAGRNDWVSGVRHLATAYGDIVKEVKDLLKDDKAGVRLEEKRDKRNVAKAKRLDKKADHLLGLPKGYGPMIRE